MNSFPHPIVKEFFVGKFYMNNDSGAAIEVTRRKDASTKSGYRIQAKGIDGSYKSINKITGDWYEIVKAGFKYQVDFHKRLVKSDTPCELK